MLLQERKINGIVEYMHYKRLNRCMKRTVLIRLTKFRFTEV